MRRSVFCLFSFACFLLLTMCLVFARNRSPEQTKKFLLSERNHPANRAFLDTIAYAEGTYRAGTKGYKMRYPKPRTFKSFNRHPKDVVCAWSNGKRVCSTGAGRYQFLYDVWQSVAQRSNLSDFSPLSQDLGALYLLDEKNALEDIKTGRFEKAIDKTKAVWASLPGAPYGQPTKPMSRLKKVFNDRHKHYKRIGGVKNA